MNIGRMLSQLVAATMLFADAAAYAGSAASTSAVFVEVGAWVCNQPGPLIVIADENAAIRAQAGCTAAMLKPMMVSILDADHNTGLSYVCRKVLVPPLDSRIPSPFVMCGYTKSTFLVNERGEHLSSAALKELADKTKFSDVRQMPAPEPGCAVSDATKHC